MKLLLFNAVSLLSFLLLISLAALCYRSHYHYDDAWASQCGVYAEFLSGAGVLHMEVATKAPWSSMFVHDSDDVVDDDFEPIYSCIHPRGGSLEQVGARDGFGFGYVRGNYDFQQNGESKSGFPVSPMFGVHAPDWVFAILLSILPACAIRRCWGRTTGPKGVCKRCSYDLRATLERCPECGHCMDSRF